jgi:hypothetical protein
MINKNAAQLWYTLQVIKEAFLIVKKIDAKNKNNNL